MNPDRIDEQINLVQDGTGNTQNTIFNLAHGQKNQAIPDYVRPGSQNFVGREKELEKIHEKLQTGQGVIVCAVEGLGGVGKTELALQYAQRYKEEYTAQYWFQLREIGLAQAVVQKASPYILTLPESMQTASDEAQAAWYWQNWLPETGKVLVILDDVVDLKGIPKLARPVAERFQLIVTTRKRRLSANFHEIPLEVVSEAEALELLEKMLGRGRVARELVAAKAICQYLGYLPLGLELAGRYLQLDEDLKLAVYQERLQITDESLELSEVEDIGAERGVIAAFELSWQELGETTRNLAMLLGLFDPADIAWSLVVDMAQALNLGEGQEARKQLNNSFLIKAVDEERTRFRVHSLVKEFWKWKLAQVPETNRIFRGAFVNHLLEIANNIHPLTNDKIRIAAYASPHITLARQEISSNIYNSEDDLSLKFTESAIYLEGNATISLVTEGE